ncbi:MAG TPA: hypothetical protein VNY05_13590 [Candidatus Acidoferrales bacterium]|nr:hypothetical protein [Candidatus Acidoferrales bacterium]
MIRATKSFPLLGPSRPALLGTLAALIFAAHCAGAPGTLAVTGVTTGASAQGGFIFDGTRLWTADAVKGLCRMDPAAPGFTLTNCVLPSTTTLGVTAVLGQPAYDSVAKVVYVPDMGTASKGIWRYAFNGTTFGLSATGVNIAPGLLGALRPGAVALGPDGNVYATMTGNDTIQRVNTPAGAVAAQTVDNLGVTLSGKPARGLAFDGATLWVAESDGEYLIAGATVCAVPCKGILNAQNAVFNPSSIAFDATNSLMYMGTSSGVFQDNLLTGQVVLYSKTFVNGAATGLVSNVTAVGVDAIGNLFFVNDPSVSQTVGGGTIYSVPVNSVPDGQGNVASPPPTIPPTVSLAPAFANPAQLLASGLTAPLGAVFMGTHAWVVDSALGFCKVDPTLPAPSLTACAVLPLGFVPGSPVYDKVSKQVYVGDTAGVAGIMKLPFTAVTPATEKLGVATTVVTNAVLTAAAAGATAPTALAFGPDGSVYAAMAGSTQIVRVTTPAAATHIVTAIGSVPTAGSLSIAFHNSDLYEVEVTNANIMFGASLCQGTCSSLFFALNFVPTAVASDAGFVYFGDSSQVLIFDPVANTIAIMSDTGLAGGVPTSFSGIAAIATDGLGHVFAADGSHMWEIAGSGAVPTITSLAPSTAPESTTLTVTITGTNFTPGSLVVSTCPAITPANVAVVSLTQVTATFAVNPIGPVGLCAVSIATTGGASAASNFNVLIGPPALTTITPASGFRGRTVAVSIAGGNMATGVINPIPGVTISGTVATATLTTANFVIGPTAALGPQNVTMTTPTGTSNILVFTISAAAPVLTTIAPASGVAASTVAVTLTGTDLFQGAVNPPVGFTISGIPVVTATSITATFVIASTVPAGPQSITVTTPGGISNALTFNVLPALTTIAPNTAKAGTATAVTLTGTSLTGTTSVNAGANITVSSLVVVSGTQITATFTTVASAVLGAQSITVTNAGVTSNAVTFTITAPTPSLTSITPVTGARGATVPVTLAGSGLVGATFNLPAGITVSGTPVVAFGTITASFVIDPAAPLGLQSITVTTPGGISNAVTFTTFAPLPTLASIAPAVGVANSTAAVTLTGTGLVGATFNLPAGFTVSGTPVVTFTTITASLAIASTVPAGPQNITVTTPGGTSTAVSFKILPNLVSIAPSQGRAGSATVVTLTGTSLAAVTSVNAGANITVTGIAATAGTVTATFTSVAAAPVGPVNVTVTDVNGTSVAVVYTLTGPIPVITTLTPATGGTGSTVPVTITGTGLTLGTLNLPVGITVTGTPVVSFTQITASLLIAGNAPLGAQSITVTTPGTGNLSNAKPFTVFALAPLISTIAPATATAGTTVPVTLTGQGFTGVTAVNVGAGITVSSFTIVSGSQINATFVVAATAATQQISVTNPNGTSNTVTFGIVPTLSSIAPASLPASLSTTVTLTGTSLTGATVINAGANITVTNLVVVSTTQITATFAIAAAAVTGNRNITVTTPGGTTGAVVFNVLPPPPTITAVNSPFKRGSNQGITLAGANLTGVTATANIQLLLNGTAVATASEGFVAGSLQITATQLRWNWTVATTLPASGAGQVYTLTVTTPSGTTAPFAVTVQ